MMITNYYIVYAYTIRALHPNNLFGFLLLDVFGYSNTVIYNLNKRLGAY